MAARKSGLGKGLESLIPVERPDRGYAAIPVDAISPNPDQPRSQFDQEGLAGLAASIAAVGILQPLVVRESGDGYELVAGERRLRAAKIAGLTEVPAVIRAGDDSSSLAEALIENVQREDLTPLEEAAGLQQLMEDHGMTHEEVGKRVGKSRSAITNAVRLLSLPAAVQGFLERGELSAGHARALAGLDDDAYAAHIAERAAAEGWTVRQVEDAVRARGGGGSPSTRRAREPRPAEVLELETRLADRLEAPVTIDYGKRGGKMVIRFGDLDALQRIYVKLFGGA